MSFRNFVSRPERGRSRSRSQISPTSSPKQIRLTLLHHFITNISLWFLRSSPISFSSSGSKDLNFSIKGWLSMIPLALYPSLYKTEVLPLVDLLPSPTTSRWKWAENKSEIKFLLLPRLMKATVKLRRADLQSKDWIAEIRREEQVEIMMILEPIRAILDSETFKLSCRGLALRWIRTWKMRSVAVTGGLEKSWSESWKDSKWVQCSLCLAIL